MNECAYIGAIHKFCMDIVTSRGNLIGLPDELHIYELYNDRLQIFKGVVEANPQFKDRHLTNDYKENQKLVRDLLGVLEF